MSAAHVIRSRCNQTFIRGDDEEEDELYDSPAPLEIPRSHLCLTIIGFRSLSVLCALPFPSSFVRLEFSVQMLTLSRCYLLFSPPIASLIRSIIHDVSRHLGSRDVTLAQPLPRISLVRRISCVSGVNRPFGGTALSKYATVRLLQ